MHITRRRKGKYVYAAVEKTIYRPGKTPQKKIVKWLGRVADFLIANLKSEPGAAAYAAWEQEQLERVERKEKAYQEALQRLPEGLRMGPVDPIDPGTIPTASPEQSSPTPDTPQEAEPSLEPSSDPSPDPSPSEPASEPSSEKS